MSECTPSTQTQSSIEGVWRGSAVAGAQRRMLDPIRGCSIDWEAPRLCNGGTRDCRWRPDKERIVEDSLLGVLAARQGSRGVFQIWRLRDAASITRIAHGDMSPPFPHPSSCILRRGGSTVRPDTASPASPASLHLHCCNSSSNGTMSRQPIQFGTRDVTSL